MAPMDTDAGVAPERAGVGLAPGFLRRPVHGGYPSPARFKPWYDSWGLLRTGVKEAAGGAAMVVEVAVRAARKRIFCQAVLEAFGVDGARTKRLRADGSQPAGDHGARVSGKRRWSEACA